MDRIDRMKTNPMFLIDFILHILSILLIPVFYFVSIRMETDLPWASSPSSPAILTISCPSRFNPFSENQTIDDFLTKSSTDRGEKKRAVPPVGRVWLGPAR